MKKAQEKAAKAAETWSDSTQLAQQYQVSAYVSAISEQGYAQAKMRTLEDVPEEFRKPIALREAIHRLTEEIRNWEKETEETATAREKAVSAYAAAEDRKRGLVARVQGSGDIGKVLGAFATPWESI